MNNILQMQGIPLELRRAFSEIGSLAIPFGTPVNAVASTATIAAADIAIVAADDKVVFGGVDYVKKAVPDAGKGEWDNAAALAALLNVVPGWDAAVDNGAVVITAAIRGVFSNGNIVTVEVLEDTTAGGDGAGTEAMATIAAATIARLANGDTVEFGGAIFTKAAVTSVSAGEFANAAGLIQCIDGMDDWAAADNAGAIDITAVTDAVDFNGIDITVLLYRTTAGGRDGTPGFRGAVCCDVSYIYVCTATDETIQNNNWERLANQLVTF